MTRYIHVAHRLTGWNAVKNRAEQLGLELDDAQLKYLTNEIKAAADHRGLTLDDVDSLLYNAAQRNDGVDPVAELEVVPEGAA